MARKKRFKGFDWTELADRWGIDYHDDDDAMDSCQNVMKNAYGDEKEAKRIANDIREYLVALANATKKLCYHHPVWVGMAKIEDDETLISFTGVLLDRMWS